MEWDNCKVEWDIVIWYTQLCPWNAGFEDFFKEMYSFIHQEWIKLIKTESKCIYDAYQLFFSTF